MQMEAFAACDIGLARESNEDRFLVDDDLKLFAVSDGMGGHAAGEVAAQRSIEIASSYIRDRAPIDKIALTSPDGYFRVLRLAEDAVEEASRQLYRQASTNNELSGMGATLTMLMVVDDKGIMAHVGDSRLYLLREGELHLLSSDHTMAQELHQAGALSREEAVQSHYAHVLTRAVGTHEAVQPESLLFDLLPGDTCLVCSDGLSNYFSNNAEVANLLANENLRQIPDRLVEFAKSRGGHDNITAVVARVGLGSSENSPTGDQLKTILTAMGGVFLFRGLSLSRLTHVINIASIVDFRPGQRVIAQGEPCEGLYIVLDGAFTLRHDFGLTERLVPGQWYGAVSLMHERPSRATIVAQTASRMMYISGSDFDRLTQRQPRLGRRLLRRLCKHLSAELHRQSLDDFNLSDTVDP